MTGKPARPEYLGHFWWLVLSFFVPFIIAGSYGSVHIALRASHPKHALSDAERDRFDTTEDAKEQDEFMRVGTLSGVGGVLLTILGFILARRRKKHKDNAAKNS